MASKIVLAAILTGGLVLAGCEGNDPPASVAETDPAPPVQVQVEVETSDEVDEGFAQVREQAGEAADALQQLADTAMQTASARTQEARDALAEASVDVRDAISAELDSAVTRLEEMRDETMTDAEKLEAVQNARAGAENAARAAGLSPDQILEAGQVAENAARRVLGL